MNNTITTNTDTLAANLHTLVDQYLDGLITLQELTEHMTERSGGQATRECVVAAPGLGIAYTPDGVASLLARINATPDQTSAQAATRWIVGPDGDKITGQLLLSAEGTTPPDGDNDWLMPTITYTLPAGTIKGDSIADHHRRLRSDFGLLDFDER